jgi:hypothetical protein
MAKVNFSGLKTLDFVKQFNRDKDYPKYDSNTKWADGYSFKKCKNTADCSGKKAFSSRCIKCRYDKSPTVLTGFDK